MDCIFCNIVKGKLPCYKVYEDDLFLGFLDIFPSTKGKTLLIPKKHYRWVNDVPEFAAYWQTARAISNKIIKKLNASSISYLTYGEEVPHAHIHITPLYPGGETYLTFKKPEKYSEEEMREIQKKISLEA